jgi:hypothetical protein
MSFDLHTLKTKPRILTVSESVRCNPRIVLSGAWLGYWGFVPRNRLSAYYVAAAHLLLKPEPALEHFDLSQGSLKDTAPVAALPVLKNRGPHPLTVSQSDRHDPQITITGAWLRVWGFTIGDRISVTRTEDGFIDLRVVMPAEEWRQIQKKKGLEREATYAMSKLEQHKAIHPALYEQVPNPPQKRVAVLKPVRTPQPSLFDQIMTATHDYNVAVAARSANLPLSG